MGVGGGGGVQGGSGGGLGGGGGGSPGIRSCTLINAFHMVRGLRV